MSAQIGIGSTVWLLSELGKRPEAMEASIADETKRSWVLSTDLPPANRFLDESPKFPKLADKNGVRWTAQLRCWKRFRPTKYQVFLTVLELNATCDEREKKDRERRWVWNNRDRIRKCIDAITDIEILRQIAALVGYAETVE